MSASSAMKKSVDTRREVSIVTARKEPNFVKKTMVQPKRMEEACRMEERRKLNSAHSEK